MKLSDCIYTAKVSFSSFFFFNKTDFLDQFFHALKSLRISTKIYTLNRRRVPVRKLADISYPMFLFLGW